MEGTRVFFTVVDLCGIASFDGDGISLFGTCVIDHQIFGAGIRLSEAHRLTVSPFVCQCAFQDYLPA